MYKRQSKEAISKLKVLKLPQKSVFSARSKILKNNRSNTKNG
jgi:hypothetical protein